ncbi:MAG: hypothetical protein HKO64_00740 [Xanthomonadales bacterium]|nr:hypothetical protein [Gammaproteobacteria bacterium]NNE04463.1 hypothetical protein [Xanthomonadales bacterium]NNL94123.1 hypothetical protein [Xanthomonadales bacterium]
MNELNEKFDQARDPLGLRHLDWIEPQQDGWPGIRAALEERSRNRKRVTWLALAASLVMAFGLTLRLASENIPGAGPASLPVTEQLADGGDDSLESLIALSQTLEQQLRGMRQGSGSMPADSAVYIAELQDLVAQVDHELSYSPDSVNLWGQRVNLLLDLAQIYQHQWELDYGKMASL